MVAVIMLHIEQIHLINNVAVLYGGEGGKYSPSERPIFQNGSSELDPRYVLDLYNLPGL